MQNSGYSRNLGARFIAKRSFLWYVVILALMFWIYSKFFGSTKINSDSDYNEDKPPFPSPPSKFTPYDQEDPVFVSYVRQHHITEPSEHPYTFSDNPTTTTNITRVLWPLLKKIVGSKKGFFVEAGAFDGVGNSNTVWLERVQGWTGLLVECHPKLVPILRSRQRKAYIADACLSKYSSPAKVELTSPDGWHGSSSMGSGKNLFTDYMKTFTKFQVQTIPLYTLLAAINVTTVDFISLDVQALELEVLQHFPFHLILVKVWVIEVAMLPPEKILDLEDLMKQNGYRGPGQTRNVSDWDQVYVHKSVEQSLT